MGNARHDHADDLIVNLVENPVIALSNAILLLSR